MTPEECLTSWSLLQYPRWAIWPITSDHTTIAGELAQPDEPVG